MRTVKNIVYLTLTMAFVCGIVLVSAQSTAFAHCDTLDGPVIIEAKDALNKGDITPILKWVKKENEAEIKAVFKEVLAVRSNSEEVKALADRYFLETLIRLHRAGEGAPYTGLKAVGTIEPAVAAADKAIESGSVDELAGKVGKAAEKAIKERFERVIKAKEHKDESIEAGREYVEAYVIYVHFVEGLHNTITQGGAHGAHVSEKNDEGHGH